ncbi:hypothetical protein B0H17DRAFT_1333756 [Mycena rosella]|uniref:Uncharacterized protein n=1 Tax=Mycena rosella TaxID=1033263 RepID=A0AAD7D7J4_MYCRO|nr:hypothetical protein B0H17DRAFT_1333756 [Mycena rosella]
MLIKIQLVHSESLIFPLIPRLRPGPSSHPRTPTVVLINEVSNGGGFVTSSEISNTPTDSVFPLASSGFLLTGVYTTCITLIFGMPTPDPFTPVDPDGSTHEHLEAHAPTSYAFAFTFTFAVGSVAPTAMPTATGGPFSDPVPTGMSTADQQVTPSPESPDGAPTSTSDPDAEPTESRGPGRSQYHRSRSCTDINSRGPGRSQQSRPNSHGRKESPVENCTSSLQTPFPRRRPWSSTPTTVCALLTG